MNLEEYLSTRMNEMNTFYSKLNLPMSNFVDQSRQESTCPTTITMSQQGHNDSMEQHVKSAVQLSNEFLQQDTESGNNFETQQSERPRNPFDDVPIKSNFTTFDELLEHQIEPLSHGQERKAFLKKGTRQFLSNAQTRSEIQKKEHDEMLKQNGEQVPKKKPNYLQKGKGKNCNTKHNDEVEQSRIEDTQSEKTSIVEVDKHNNQESEKLRKERKQLEERQKQLEERQKQFMKQVEEWNKKKEIEKQEFEQYKEQERRKLQKMQQNQQQSKANRKVMEENDQLKRYVVSLTEEIKIMKQNQLVQIDRLRRKIEQQEQLQQSGKSRSNSYAAMHSNSKMSINELDEQDDELEDEPTEQDNDKKVDLTTIWPNHKISISMINKTIDECEFEYQNNKYYKQYIRTNRNSDKLVNQNVGQDGKAQKVYQSGKKEVTFNNGVKREVFPDGFVIVHFTNKDIKQTFPDGTIIYYFSDAKTTQTTFPNGPNIYRFANGQIEMHFQDGSKEIRFADGTQKFILMNGEEETLFMDGIFQRVDSHKTKFIEYPNGLVDVIHPDGRKERRSPQKK